MIVKVQLPLSSTLASPPALVYSKDRKCMMKWQVNDELKQKMNGKVKAYFNTKKNDKGRLVLLDEVAEQAW